MKEAANGIILGSKKGSPVRGSGSKSSARKSPLLEKGVLPVLKGSEKRLNSEHTGRRKKESSSPQHSADEEDNKRSALWSA